jgi:hypothetical protein
MATWQALRMTLLLLLLLSGAKVTWQAYVVTLLPLLLLLRGRCCLAAPSCRVAELG